MIRLTYSNRTENLLERLVADLAAGRAAAGPLEPARLVVPNRNVETWLRFGLASACGIAANLEVRFLRKFLAETLATQGPPLVEGARLHDLVLSLLLDDDRLKGAAFRPIRRYLDAGQGTDAVDLRRFQLSARIAHLFEEYEYSRPEMLDAWQRGPVLAGTPFAAAEAWQRPLWLAIHGPDGMLHRRDGSLEGVRLGDLLRRPDAMQVPARLHVFGVSYVARAFQRLFAQVAAKCELLVYTLNPCAEFWEDVAARGGGARLPRRSDRLAEGALDAEDPFGFEDPDDSPPLRLWGKPGRENVRLLNELTGCDFEPAFPAPAEAGTLLRRLQDDILVRAPVPAEPIGIAPDASIRLMACPGIRRECEVIASEIRKLVQEDEGRDAGRAPLRFNDIAVIVTTRERDEYFTHLSAALKENHAIPHNVTDLDFAATSRVAGAVEQLLALPSGHFTRREIMAIATHPCTRALMPEVDTDEWLRWCDDLGIVHGADRGDHEGTYIEADALNWDQGLRRLALGRFLGDGEPFEVGGEWYLPREVPPSSDASAARLALLVRSLLADARFARSARLAMPDWATFLAGLVSSYVGVCDDTDERDRERCLSALRELASRNPGGRVSWRIACETARQALGGIAVGKGHHLADGVVVSTSQPMRALPFRVIFLAGLGEGKFPASDRRDRMDLREARRRAGDVSAREQDRYMFLETLLCARERLYLSWGARDALTGEALEPSSVIVELQHILRRAYLGDRVDDLTVRPALRRYDAAAIQEALGDSSAPIHSPSAEAEAVARAMRERIPPPRETDGPVPLKDRIEASTRPILASRLLLPDVPARPKEPADAAIRISLDALRRFLECPLQGWARYRLGLRDGESEDLGDREDEPFETHRLDAIRLLGKVFSGADDDEGLRCAYAAAERREVAAGRLPLGLFAEAERGRHLRILGEWNALRRQEGASLAAGRVRFGPADEPDPAENTVAPLVLTVQTPQGERKVELVGATGTLLESPRGSLFAEYRRPKKSDWERVRRLRRALRAFVDGAAMTAAGLGDGRQACLILLADGTGQGASELLRFGAFSRTDALAWLARIAGDLVGGDHAYLLPCEAVLYAHEKVIPIADAVEDLVDAARDVSPVSAYGPLADPWRYPVPDDAEAVAERRFGAFWSRLEVEGQGSPPHPPAGPLPDPPPQRARGRERALKAPPAPSPSPGLFRGRVGEGAALSEVDP